MIVEIHLLMRSFLIITLFKSIKGQVKSNQQLKSVIGPNPHDGSCLLSSAFLPLLYRLSSLRLNSSDLFAYWHFCSTHPFGLMKPQYFPEFLCTWIHSKRGLKPLHLPFKNQIFSPRRRGPGRGLAVLDIIEGRRSKM